MAELTLLDALRDPQMRHAAVVHIPVALSALGVLLVAAAALIPRSHALRWTAATAYVLLVLSALVAVRSGEDAEAGLDGVQPARVSELVEEHEELAEKVWILAAVTAGLVGLSALSVSRIRPLAGGLSIVSGLVCAGWVAFTAHHGGTLVYEWGVGTPKPVTFVDAGGSASGESDASGSVARDDRAPIPDPRVVFYLQRVQPVLEQNCYRCHNPKRHKADLDQTTIVGLLLGGISGPAVVPGHPEESWLIKAVRHEEDLEMPPDKDQLPAATIADLEQWVRDGAAWAPLDAPDNPD